MYTLKYCCHGIVDIQDLDDSDDKMKPLLVDIYRPREKWQLTRKPEVEAMWHLFLWAVIANEREMAEHFLFETDCIVGNVGKFR